MILGADAFSVSASSAATDGQSPWPSALHDSSHTATSSTSGPTHGTVKWTRSLGGNITPGPVVAADGTIYVATNAGVLHALNPSTGVDVWTFSGGGPYTGETDLSTSPLILPSGDLLWPGPQNTLYELSSAGQPLWSHQFTGSVLSPALSGSKVYLELMSGVLWKLDVGGAVPQLGWSIRVGHRSFGSPVIDTNGDVITTVDQDLVAVEDRGSSGMVRWRYATTADIEVSPSVSGSGNVYVSANDGSVYRLTSNGALVWRRHIGQESYSSSSITTRGLLYFGDNGGVLNVVRATTGKEVERDHGLKGIWGAQAIDTRGNVYFGTQGGGIYGYGPDGQQLFHIHANGPIDSYPALSSDGTLLIGDEAGTFYAIG
jgi:outer membrane protein assembly factor BamB